MMEELKSILTLMAAIHIYIYIHTYDVCVSCIYYRTCAHAADSVLNQNQRTRFPSMCCSQIGPVLGMVHGTLGMGSRLTQLPFIVLLCNGVVEFWC